MRQHPEVISHNPFRHLPPGDSAHGRNEPGIVRDEARDRRLAPGEEELIHSTLRGAKRDDRKRARVKDPDEKPKLFFDAIIAIGVRLREAYRLRFDGLDSARRLIQGR